MIYLPDGVRLTFVKLLVANLLRLDYFCLAHHRCLYLNVDRGANSTVQSLVV